MQRHFSTVNSMKRYISELEELLCSSPADIYELHEQLIFEGIYFNYKPLTLEELEKELYSK